MTVNQALKTNSYPLHKVDDLFASLAGGKSFSKLDLANAYQQILLDKASKKLVVINTHKGLFQYNRLPFGVPTAPSIFQRIMETLLQELPEACLYLDDILIIGNLFVSSPTEIGYSRQPEKCLFMVQEVECLGHKISARGLQPTQEKIRAIRDAPCPKKVSEPKYFLGMLNYYGKLLLNLSTNLAPLRIYFIREVILLVMGHRAKQGI